MDSIDLSSRRQAILSDRTVLNGLPPELLEIISSGETAKLLDAVAAASLIPSLTLRFFARFDIIFADTCARWIFDLKYQRNEVLQAFARILRFAPHLSVYLLKYLEPAPPLLIDDQSQPRVFVQYLAKNSHDDISKLPDKLLQGLLLAALRLLNFDESTFAPTISGSKVQILLRHPSPPVRYLAVRLLCEILSASDLKLEEMIMSHCGGPEAVIGDFDGGDVDYGFLPLYEDNRRSLLEEMRQDIPKFSSKPELYRHADFSPFVASFGDTLLPRPDGEPARQSPLVVTGTTSVNMNAFAKMLLSESPILVYGLSGSGKTCIVDDFARELGKDSSMVTLHLNEQTDVKMLIGMYAAGSVPGSFAWQPGVLTTAIREGRWVFIEDLDRAPNEVLSVILPLIERRELLIPSRGITLRAASGFRLIASIRTTLNINGHEIPPTMYMLGTLLWNRVPILMPTKDEFARIINGNHPILHKFLPGIISLYDRLCALSHNLLFPSRSRSSTGRPINPRDLLKWCRRLGTILIAAKSKTGEEPISDVMKNEMFMEAADCFAGHLQTVDARKSMISAIAEEMHIPPQHVDHYLAAYNPRYEEDETCLRVGRARILKRKKSGRAERLSKQPRPFARTAHARRLLEQVGVALKMAEPVLLVGETGIGKTTVVQELADTLGFKLTVLNLSQQSEVGDLLGGFKPVNVRNLAIPLKEEFDDLFASTGISATRNQKYLEQLGRYIAKGQWSKASKLWHEAPRMFDRIIMDISEAEAAKLNDGVEQRTKRRKTESRLQGLLELKPRWARFSQNLDLFDVQLSGGSKGFAFSFVEGNIVKAVRNGEWVLLDEINLASPDTLESIADLLHSGSSAPPSLLLSETGEIERVKAHSGFRIFAAMNPATDIGKRDLPIGLRSRFTEIYVESPDRDLNDLLSIISAYLKGTSTNDERAAHDVALLYLDAKRLAEQRQLVDGANQVPHFSLRTLTRVLGYVTEIAQAYGLRRALYEGFCMGFLTLLNKESENMLMPRIYHRLLDSHGNPDSLLAQTPSHPEDGRKYVRFSNKKRDRQYWMLQGRETPQEQINYIITPFVERNMLNLVRATSTRKFPILVQGPTSSGKTSMIEYLAKFSGNKFVRINNHEHTDLQEYLGTYVSGLDGQLRFQEGLLVQALREGHWIVLDELNLAPSDVLEALNRLLDDNRELLIPETQEVVHPHQNFMLFATQNPPGLYGGRKALSRAFRNRFLELHFDDIPEDELEYILEQRSQKVAPSDCRRIVAVYKELSRLRQSNRLFEQKDSFATLRDLFRWTMRDSDNREQIAANGFMLLAERVRKSDEKTVVKEVIERIFKVKIDLEVLYAATLSPEIKLYDTTVNRHGIVWTNAMRRLYILVSHALRNNEPVLLVGETGCGKTTVCQMLAEAFKKQLHTVNAHQNTETGDLIGAQRPIRNRAAIIRQLQDDLMEALGRSHNSQDNSSDEFNSLMVAYNVLSDEIRSDIPIELRQRIVKGQLKAKALFEWSDGSLVQAMKEAQFFLLDEISLADDSVLERLNSVLESQRTILLAEKGVEDSSVQAADGFQFFATMNPGGDYGKRELSPALRNRFTEIWVPPLSDREDILQIVTAKLVPDMKCYAPAIVDFAGWFGDTYHSSTAQTISVRDVLAWITFINGCESPDPYFAVVHGAAMTYIDTLGANPAALLAINPENISEERRKNLQHLSTCLNHDIDQIYAAPVIIRNTEEGLSFGDFCITKTSAARDELGFAFEAPTTKLNAMRIARALQVRKPILIEGSPGVGKTTLITALARVVGKPLTRINLSEQTDLMDLFGSDVPVDGSEAGNFAWRDAPFLKAMQSGYWVLLDEMNLASQSVLEGLNACLDHRGEVYVSELDQTFIRHRDFRVFAAQNPHHQGGGRKGLPTSFVNRFTVVYAEQFRNNDLSLICRQNFPMVSDEIMSNVIEFVSTLEREVLHRRRFGSQGAPWEFNLRDTLRWLQLLDSTNPLLFAACPADFLGIIFRQRFRTAKDRNEVDKIFTQVFGSSVPFRHNFHNFSSDGYQVGMAYLKRNSLVQKSPFPEFNMIPRLPELESVMICVAQNLPCLLVGPSGSGKTTLIQEVAAAASAELVVLPLNSDIDTMDLVGGFEQADPQRAASGFLERLSVFLHHRINSSFLEDAPPNAIEILQTCRSLKINSSSQGFTTLYRLLSTLQEETKIDLSSFSSQCQVIASQLNNAGTARFEWVDGILLKAMEDGKWIVLDNANLCSSSVLDRLNSLLEPDGFLSINEHCDLRGEPKIIRPHKNFRIFLTMDPRYGELSRAMRNRTTEIYVDIPEASFSNIDGAIRQGRSISGYKNVVKAVQISYRGDQSGDVVRISLDHLSTDELKMLRRFIGAIHNGVTNNVDSKALQVLQQYPSVIDWHAKDFGAELYQLYELLKTAVDLPPHFADAQPLHPLQNSPLVQVLQRLSGSDGIFWLGAQLDTYTDIAAARAAMDDQKLAAATLKTSQMSRLQRSMSRGLIPSVAGDSTVAIESFLLESLNAIIDHLRVNCLYFQGWKCHKKLLGSLMQVIWETFRLVSSPSFEEATFQAHLAIIRDILSSKLQGIHIANDSAESPEIVSLEASDHLLVNNFHSRIQKCFSSRFQLTTGLSMEELWQHFRPLSILTFETLHTLIDMENLAARFDSLKWRLSISISEISRITSSLIKAYHLILTSEVDGNSLVQTVQSEISALEDGLSEGSLDIKPFFSAQFEALRQYETLQHVKPANDVIALLSTNSSTYLIQQARASVTSTHLHRLEYLWGQDEALLLIQNSFSADLLRKLYHMDGVDLGSLNLLEAELPILGQHIAQNSALMCRDQALDLNADLLQLVNSVIKLHGKGSRKPSRSLMEQLESRNPALLAQIQQATSKYPVTLAILANLDDSCPQHFQDILHDHLLPVLVAIAQAKNHPLEQLRHSSWAWVHFALGCIKLYVPDRPFDPSTRRRLERQWHSNLKNAIEIKIAALREFENISTGQDTNLRCQLLENELVDLREPIEALPAVLRPQTSELETLQGEFNNLLATISQARPQEIVKLLLESTSEDATGGIKILQRNISQIIKRLSERFREYSDMTVPVIGMLRCLQIGLNMATVASTPETTHVRAIIDLSKSTPYLGGGPPTGELNTLDNPLETLNTISLLASVEGLRSFPSDRRQLLYDAFHSCYERWSSRLDADRKEAEASSSLYRFRGSAEDEEEDNQDEFREIFPSYNDELSDVNDRAAPRSARDTAVMLTEIHARIFVGGDTPKDSILRVLRDASKRIGILHSDETTLYSLGMTEALLPGALWSVNNQIEALSSVSTGHNLYNFYTDVNLLEIRKLVSVVHKIQVRFQELQSVDEIAHMQPLEDVMVSCKELLQFPHTEPLAKVITKVERIHAFMHEWQFGGWASRANSILTLYDNLTSTIIGWRRLELTTWAKLFDMENKKCDDDAKSWWFIAYEVIIATPLSRVDSESEMREYAQKLLKDLETYFSSAIQGQFVQRLRLLHQLKQHLELLSLEYPAISIIWKAVVNFTDIYDRFEKPVAENLQQGRQVLEKAMKEVILLASWKDTNIVALRDSARRSHHKLFKIVRKYRAILGRPMESILAQGLPDEADGSRHIVPLPQDDIRQSLDTAALALCESTVPQWSMKNQRFLNASKTAAFMDDACRVPESAIQGAQYIESFLANILTSTAELQKATPSKLTDDNKALVKHLKFRKRKVFADSIRELRQMGVQHNLGTVALAKQDSLSKILSSTENLQSRDALTLKGINYYYHKSLDLMPRARTAARQHSEDLTNSEATRSIGLLEGLLQLVLKQRNTLLVYEADFKKVDHAVQTAAALWAPGKYSITNPTSNSDHKTVLRWIPNILQVGLQLVDINGKLGKTSTKDVQGVLTSYAENFAHLADCWNALPSLTTGVNSTAHEKLVQQVDEFLHKLTKDLTELESKYPHLGFILRQISPWTVAKSAPLPTLYGDSDVSGLDRSISTACDSILVSIQKFATSSTDMPQSTEDPAWLAKSTACLGDSIAKLHIPEITTRINESLQLLTTLDLDHVNNGRVAGALFEVTLPIFKQYHVAVRQALERYSNLHRATCKMTYVLAKTFIQIASQGYCTPSENSDAADGKTEELEGATGLGDGTGADDISKDIQDDEDLSELAQEPNKGEQEDIQDEKDAVDIADGDMEGQIGDDEKEGEVDENKEENEEGDEEEIDEEAGDVDDLDINAVDEKMWDGEGEKADKNQEGDQSKGKASKDEQVAGQEGDKEGIEGEDGEDGEEEELGAEQSEEVNQQEAEKHDPHAEDGQALDLPEDIKIDGSDQGSSVSGSDDGLDDLSDVHNDKEGSEVQENDALIDDQDEETQENPGGELDLDVIDLDEDEDQQGEATEDVGEKGLEQSSPEQENGDDETLLQDRSDEVMADAIDDFPGDALGTGEEQAEDQAKNNNDSKSKAQRDEGGRDGDSAENRDTAGVEGEKVRKDSGDAPQNPSDETQNSAEAQPFRKLGDALEKWHRQQNKIREAMEGQERRQEQPMEVDANNAEFEHLQDKDDQGDTQALGTATEDQAHRIDDAMAIDVESTELPETFQPDDEEMDDVEKADQTDEELEQHQDDPTSEGRVGAMIKQAKPTNEDRDNHQSQDFPYAEEVEEVDNQLSTTHLESPMSLSTSRSPSSARQLWTHYESLTRSLSLSLTEQLRLILAPTVATKMRGDFRTGKRLNIKRIIPYIASQYKRDKIWMRRSVPSKRSYQIMLAVDDSKSMGESGSGSLAFETLVMISRSLSMLEVGDISIVSFGEDVRVAHDFDRPFSNEAGSQVFQYFGFDQRRTDITKLVRESIELFRHARAKTSSPADLWQLQLIISDGVCDSSDHEPIRRLLREAIEERIMMVFVIVDDIKQKRNGESVVDLKEAKFVKNEATGASSVKIERYLDTFPFQYYLIVGDVRELPSVLATLLRQWFSEVVDSGA